MSVTKKNKIMVFGLLLSLSIFSFAESLEVSNKRLEQETQLNTQYLLGHALKKSKVLQEKYADFSPFGAALFKGGAVKYVWFTKPGEKAKNPMDTLMVIRQALQTQALEGKIIGSAVVYKMQEQGDGFKLNVELEYQTGLALAFASEVSLDADKKVVWGNNAQTHYEPKIFTTLGVAEGEVVSELTK